MTLLGYLFQLALELSLLTFYIGVLIYALPIPLRGVKRWGGTLLRDSITSYAMALSILSVLGFSNYVARLLGGSWQYLNMWLSQGLSLVTSLKVVLTALSSLLSRVPVASAARALIGPFNDALTADLLFLITVAAIEAMVRYAGTLIAFIGLVLYSLPFRIGREAGAWFIAFTIVFSVGLQAMPAFISTVASAPPVNMTSEAMDLGVELVSASVRSSYGTPIGPAVLSVYVSQGGSLTLVGRYPVNSTGRAYGLEPYEDGMIAIPSTVPVYTYIDVDGVDSPLEPYPVSNASENLTLTSPYIIYSAPYDVIAVTNQPANVTVIGSARSAVIVGSIGEGGVLEVRWPSTCNVTVLSNVSTASGSWSWYGVSGEYVSIEGPSTFLLRLSAGSCRVPKLKGVSYEDYLAQFLSNAPPISPNIIEDFIIYYFTVPLMYFAVLTSITYAVARLLGGRRGIMPRVA